MALRTLVKLISTPARILMLLTLLLAAVLSSQIVIPVAVLGRPPEDLWEEPPEPELTEAQKRQKRIADAGKHFLPDGTLHLVDQVKTEGTGRMRTIRYTTEVRDVNDNLLWSGMPEDLPYEYIFSPMYAGMHSSLSSPISEQTVMPTFSRTLIIPVVPAKDKVSEYWRYEPQGRYFVGFDPDDQRIGYAGANGIHRSASKVERFEELVSLATWCPQDSYSPLLLWQTKRRLYKVNFPMRRVDVIFDAREKEISRLLFHKYPGIKRRIRNDLVETAVHQAYRPALYIATDDNQHHLLLEDPNQHITIKAPREWGWRLGSVYVTKDTIFLEHSGAEGVPDPHDRKRWREWIKNQQYSARREWRELYHITSTGDLKLINRFEWLRPAKEKSQEPSEWKDFGERYERTMCYVKAISPPVYELIYRACYPDGFDLYETRGVGEFMVFTVLNPDPLFYYEQPRYLVNRPLNWALSLLMVCIVLVHARPRRTSPASAVFWPVFVAVFNLAGLLTYFSLNHSPVIKCPACGKGRGLERPQCARCGAELPSPQPAKFDLISDT